MGRNIAGREPVTVAAGPSELLDVPLREVNHQARLPGQPYLWPGAGVPKLQADRLPTTTLRRSHLPLRLLRLFVDGVQIDPHDLPNQTPQGTIDARSERREAEVVRPRGRGTKRNESKKAKDREHATAEAAKQRSRSLCPS
ncbi:hypothetical protein B296_00027520 [Ensete ventricosum]|uniref:Uncharacterized protein n=1 Tax=Ensete ventricosum TaxID=4639 RepID=A0A427AJD7_ENSVE|nr:hypothetical protein B296_00027520 [Ensete ventricosum]